MGDVLEDRRGQDREMGTHRRVGCRLELVRKEAALDWASLGTHILVNELSGFSLCPVWIGSLGVSLGQGFPGWSHTFPQLAQLCPDCVDSFLQRLVQGFWGVPNVQVRQCVLPLVPINLSQTPQIPCTTHFDSIYSA